MLRSLAKPRIVLTRTTPPSRSHQTTEVCGVPSRVTVVSAATRGCCARSVWEAGITTAVWPARGAPVDILTPRGSRLRLPDGRGDGPRVESSRAEPSRAGPRLHPWVENEGSTRTPMPGTPVDSYRQWTGG